MAQFDDQMLPEYDFNQLGQPVRGKHANAMRQGYSVTIHHPDKLPTVKFHPHDANLNAPIYYGDKIMDDKIENGKVGNDKIE